MMTSIYSYVRSHIAVGQVPVQRITYAWCRNTCSVYWYL